MNDKRRESIATALLNISLVLQLAFVSLGMASAIRHVLETKQPVDQLFLSLQLGVFLSWVAYGWVAKNRQIILANGGGALSGTALLATSLWVSG
jgi:hypothetical protein